LKTAIITISIFLAALLAALLHSSHFIVAWAVFLILLGSVYRPLLPLYILALVLPFFGNNPGGAHALYIVDILLIVTLLRWLLPFVWRRSPQIKGSSAFPWIVLFLFVTILSLIPMRHELYKAWLWVGGNPLGMLRQIYSAYAVDAFWSFRMTLDLCLSVLFYFFMINNLKNREELHRIGFIALSSYFLSLVIGIFDYHRLIDLTFFRPENPDILRFGYRRLMSLFSHSGWYAEYLVILAPLYFGPALVRAGTSGHKVGPDSGPGGLTGRVVPSLLRAGMVFLPVSYGVLFTYQRGGWLAFIASISVLIWLLYSDRIRRIICKRKKIVFVSAVAFAAAIAAVLLFARGHDTPLAARISKIAEGRDRTVIWRQALSLYGQKPLLGIGAGNYYFYHRSCFPQDHPWFHSDKVTAHSTYIHILTERGPFALLFYMMILVTAFHGASAAFRLSRNDPFMRGFSAALLSSLTAIVVYGIFQYIFYLRIIELMCWAIFALSAAAPQLAGAPHLAAPENTRPAMLKSVLFLCCLLFFQHTSRDHFFWSRYSDDVEERFTGSWMDPWDERIIHHSNPRHEVLEARYIVFHTDAAKHPVTVMMFANGRLIASAESRDKREHFIAAMIPPGLKPPYRVRFKTDRPWFSYEEFPHLRDRTPYPVMVGRDIRTRRLGLEGMGFHKWEETGIGPCRWTSDNRAMCDIRADNRFLIWDILAGNPDIETNPLQVTVRISEAEGGRKIAEENLLLEHPGVFKRIAVNMDEAGCGGRMLRLEIETARTFCLLDFNGSDSRILGVYTTKPRFAPEP